MPNNADAIDESGEPLKTLRFVYTRGRAVEKWGPLPNVLYAPVYAGPLAYWYATGGLSKPATDYPYGFSRPHEQAGLLIVLARLVGLAVSLGCLAYYGRALYRFTASGRVVCLVLVLFVATSPELAYKAVATKPDGLMLAFLAASMGVYADIVGSGLTRWRGALLTLFAVFSVSCKELTVPVYAFVYAGLALAGWRGSRGDPGLRWRFARDLGFTLAFGVAAYGVLNVVYAPATWIERMKIWLVGPGKDPNVWAASVYPLSAYLIDSCWALLLNIGPGGVAAVAVAAAVALAAPVPHRVPTWLPSLGFLSTILLTAGYMPVYFLCPLAVTLPLPVAAALAHAERQWLLSAPRLARTALSLTILACCLANAWQGLLAPARTVLAATQVIEDYCKRHVSKTEWIHTGNFWVRQPGFDRLSYLGYNVDDQPLGALMNRPERMPDVVLLTTEQLQWIQDFKNRPARNRMMEASGYSYCEFPGMEALGYRLVERVRPDPTWLNSVPWIPPQRGVGRTEVCVYRRP